MTTDTFAAADGTAPDADPAPDPAVPFAGFWRRACAFLLDCAVLGLIGQVIGWAAEDRLVSLGPWGRAVGFVVACLYFGLLGSRPGGGQTLGKRLLGLRVVRLDGEPLPAAQGLWRAAVLCVPWFLNGAAIDPALLAFMPLLMLLSMLVFALGLALVYLLVFNRPSRRSLHDWAAGSVVVRRAGVVRGSLPVPGWRGHRGVVVLLVLLSVAAPWFVVGAGAPFDALAAMQATVAAEPGVRSAGVWQGRVWMKPGLQAPAVEQTQLAVTVLVRRADADVAGVARRVARALLDRCPEARQVDMLSVDVVHGFDIGIASRSVSFRAAASPAQWREALST